MESQNDILEVTLDRMEQEGVWFTTKDDKLYANAKDLYRLDKYGELEDKSKERLVNEVEQYLGDGAAFIIEAVDQWLEDNLAEGIIGYVDTLAMNFEIKPATEEITAYQEQGEKDLELGTLDEKGKEKKVENKKLTESVNKDNLIKAMELLGYYYDDIASYDGYIKFNDIEGFNSWDDVEEYLNLLVIEDPDISDKVEALLKENNKIQEDRIKGEWDGTYYFIDVEDSKGRHRYYASDSYMKSQGEGEWREINARDAWEIKEYGYKSEEEAKKDMPRLKRYFKGLNLPFHAYAKMSITHTTLKEESKKIQEDNGVAEESDEWYDLMADRYQKLQHLRLRYKNYVADFLSATDDGTKDVIEFKARPKGKDYEEYDPVTVEVEIGHRGKMTDEEFNTFMEDIKQQIKDAIDAELERTGGNKEGGYIQQCPSCGRTFTMLGVNLSDIHDYKRGSGLIQGKFATLNPMEREYIKTGYCPDCQKEIFGTDYTSDKIKLIKN